MEAFKNPPTPEEEKKYIALCLSGDKAARSILIEYNLRLVAHISRKYNSAVTKAANCQDTPPNVSKTSFS